MYNSTINRTPPEGRECRHPLCGSTCKKKKAPTPRKPIAKVSQKRMEDIKSVGGGNELQRWFEERRSDLTGKCQHCGGKSSKDDDKYYKYSIAHILPKSHFKSVATHPKNFIELCFFNNSCHTNFDNFYIDLIDINCFDTVVERFVEMYPFIAEDEKKRIPPVLLNYIHTDL